MKLRIAIAAGGDSAEEAISFKSAQTVYQHLDRNLYEVYIVKISTSAWEVVENDKRYPIDKNDFSYTADQDKYRFDYIFIAIHGTPGEDGKLQAYFDLLKIPYSSPDHIGSTLTFNKWYCNTLLSQLGYPVAQSYYLRRGSKLAKERVSNEIKYPCFVKPCSSGSSYGISKVKAESELLAATSFAFEFGDEIMIEEHLKGKEMSCGVYKNGQEIIALPITQIIPQGEFFDYAAKYEGHSQEITPARISSELSDKIQQQAKEIYHKLNMRGIVRIDFMLVDTTSYIIEVNAVPGLSAESIIPQQVAAAHMSLKDFFNSIIQTTKN